MPSLWSMYLKYTKDPLDLLNPTWAPFRVYLEIISIYQKKNLNFFGLQISCVEYTQVYSGLMVVYNSSAWSTNDIFQATKNLPRICSICTHSEYYDNIE